MKIFQKEDLNAFWALFADNLANMMIITGVCKYVFRMPDYIVFGKILPGLGVALVTGLAFYSYLAYKLSREEQRDNVTALPYGISTPIMFVYLFGIIGPVYWKTNDPLTAWRAGIAAAVIGGIIESAGSVVGPFLKKVTPRAGMLGTLAGIAIVWISGVPMALIFESPLIGFAAMSVLFIGLIGGIKLPFKLPAGLLSIAAGTAIGFLTGKAAISSSGMGFYPPLPVIGDLIEGFRILIANPVIWSVVLPIEIYNFIETMNNVESAEAAGDKYNVAQCQLMDGAGTLVGALFGSPFPTTVYIGHPAYKRLGGGGGYALLVGIVFFLGSIFGMAAFLHHLIPEAAVAPILVFVGIIITSQAFTAVEPKYAIASAIAIVPHISDITVKKMTGAVSEISSYLSKSLQITGDEKIILSLKNLGSGAISEDIISLLKSNQGIHYLGHTALSQGAIISGMIWGAVTAFIVDGDFRKAALFSAGGALLSATGFIHSGRLGLNMTPVFWGYAVMTAVFLAAYIFKAGKPETETAREF